MTATPDPTPAAWAPTARCRGWRPGFTDDVIKRFVQPTLDELRRRGIDYRGLLYTGLMVTDEGPKLVEYNIRFGDPDGQVVLLRLTTDLAAAPATRRPPASCAPSRRSTPGPPCSSWWRPRATPTAVRTGDPIHGLDAAEALDGVDVLCAGVADGPDGQLVTAGGRVVEVVGQGPDLPTARDARLRRRPPARLARAPTTEPTSPKEMISTPKQSFDAEQAEAGLRPALNRERDK